MDTVPEEQNSRRGTLQESAIHVPASSTSHPAGDETLDPWVGRRNDGNTGIHEADNPVGTSHQGSQVSVPTAPNEGNMEESLEHVKLPHRIHLLAQVHGIHVSRN